MKGLDEKAKKMLLLLVGIVGLLIIFIVVAFVVGKVKNSSLTFSEIEDKMVEAAKSYYSSRNSELPLNEAEEVEVNAAVLTSLGYMNELSKLQEDKSVTCDGKVIVTKAGEYYNYSPYLNCGDKYTTAYLYEELLKNVVSQGDGLYKTELYDENNQKKVNYIYRGEYPDNYVKFGSQLWRVVKISPKNEITLIQADYDFETTQTSVWDDRYNNALNSYAGINVFEDSRIKRKLDDIYNSDIIFSNNERAKLVFKKACANIRKLADVKNDGSIECSKVTEKEVKLSLLPAFDYINASLDKNCKTISDKSCGNYNYLNKYDRTWWLLTTNIESGYAVDRYAYLYDLPNSQSIRVAVNVSKNVVCAGGIGTSTNPYIIK